MTEGSKYPAPKGAASRSALNVFECFSGEFVFDVSRVERCCRLKQQHFAFFFGKRPVFDAARNDDELARLDPFGAFTSVLTIVHAKTALHHQKHLILTSLVMPGERSLKLHERDQLVIEFARDARIPVIADD